MDKQLALTDLRSAVVRVSRLADYLMQTMQMSIAGTSIAALCMGLLLEGTYVMPGSGPS